MKAGTIILILVLVAAVGAGAYFFAKSQEKSNPFADIFGSIAGQLLKSTGK